MGYSRALRYAGPIAAACLLVGCNQSWADRQSEIAERVAEDRSRDYPVGAYQMVAASDGVGGQDIYLLDTRTGSLRRCWFAVDKSLTVTCGEAKD